MRIALILAFITHLSLSALSQSFEPGLSLNTPQGIAVDEVYQVREDSRGRLFVATDQGVYMVEGSNITHFSTEDGLVDNTVFRFYVDKDDRVWALSYHGGICYFENDEWHVPAFNQDYLEKSEATFPYYFTQNENTGVYYFDNYGVDNAFYSASLKDSSIVVDSINPAIKEGYAAYALYDNNGTQLFSNRAFHASRYITYRQIILELNLHKVADKSKNGLPIDYYHFSINDQDNDLDMIIQFICSSPLPDGSKIVGTGLHLWHEQLDGTITHIARSPTPINSLNVYDNEVFVNNFRGGISRYTYEDGNLVFQEVSFPSETVSDVFKSSHGRYWVSLASGGLRKVYDFDVKDIPIPYDGTEKIARPFFLEDTTMVVAHKNYLTRYSIDLSRSEVNIEDIITLPRTLVTDYTYQYNAVEGRKILNKAYSVTLDDDFNATQYVNNIKDQFVGGLKYVRYLNDSTVLYAYRDQIYRSKIDSGIICITPDNDKYSIEDVIIQDGKLLFATSLEGILKMEAGQLEPAFPNHPQANTRITGYAHIGEGWIIAATKEEGALIFKEDTIYSITDDDILPEQFINTVGADEKHIYIGFSNSIFVGSFESGEITSYRSIVNTELGIQGTINQFLTNKEGVFIESGSKMTFLPYSLINSRANRGIYELYPIGLEESEITMRGNIPHYTLKRGRSGFVMQLTSHFPFQNALQTWYWRTDTSENWRMSTDGELQIANARDGSYELLLKYRDENGLLTDEHVALTFEVSPLLSETWWFWMIVFSPVVVLAINIIRNTLRQRRLSRELISSNMSSLKMQINPHFIFNSFNSIQYLISQKKNDTASEYLTRLAKLIRTTIERPELHRISLLEEVGYIREFLSLEAMRLDGRMKFEINIDEEINQNQVFIPPMLLQPILENAVWHGVSKKSQGGCVLVTVERSSNALVIHVEDNGDGFPQEKWHAITKGEELRGSLGLKNVITRLRLLSEMHEREYKLDLLPALHGTHFVLTLAL